MGMWPSITCKAGATQNSQVQNRRAGLVHCNEQAIIVMTHGAGVVGYKFNYVCHSEHLASKLRFGSHSTCSISFNALEVVQKLMDCRHLMTRFQQVQVKHYYHLANQCADLIALQQNVFSMTNFSEENFFITKKYHIVTKFIFRRYL